MARSVKRRFQNSSKRWFFLACSPSVSSSPVSLANFIVFNDQVFGVGESYPHSPDKNINRRPRRSLKIEQIEVGLRNVKRAIWGDPVGLSIVMADVFDAVFVDILNCQDFLLNSFVNSFVNS